MECYGAGYALLQPEPEAARYWITELGRAALAEARREAVLAFIRPFGQGPTGADVAASTPARCPACGQAQDTPDCAQREHWGAS
jgi:hypothetical protein